MALPLGLFLGGCVVAIPVVTGIAQGVEYQKKQNEEAANETRMIKFNLHVHCDSKDPIAREEVDHGTLILRHDAFAGFYIQYPDESRFPPERGLVSTISDEPPVLNWVFVDRETYEIKYNNRSGSIAHIVGEWDWTQDETHMLFQGWEGFVAVDEWDGADEDESTPWGREGLRWALYYDIEDNGLKGRRRGRDIFEVALERKIQSEEDQLKQLEEAEKKMQVKTRGGLSTQFSAPAKERTREWEKKFGEGARRKSDVSGK